MNCNLCPRRCSANRDNSEKGICGQTRDVKLARAALHYWEEPCISGQKGSGAIFFSGCPLHCVYCQNKKIAMGELGKVVSENRLRDIFYELEQKGANNINLVTPTHFVPTLVRVLEKVKNEGFELPIVYNTSSYENVDTLKMLDGLVDIYLPDFKYYDSELAQKYSHAPDYPVVAAAAIDEMVRQTKECRFIGDNEDDLMSSGTIVRHLVLPGHVDDSKKVIKYLKYRYDNKIYISIMNQYTPVGDLREYPHLTRKVTDEEYEEVVDYAIEIGVCQGFIQEGDTAEESFIPSFDLEGV